MGEGPVSDHVGLSMQAVKMHRHELRGISSGTQDTSRDSESCSRTGERAENDATKETSIEIFVSSPRPTPRDIMTPHVHIAELTNAICFET
jgi:hypothetical protein